MVEVYRGGQFATSPLLLANLGVQEAKTSVTMGLQRAHAEFVGQCQGLLVGAFGSPPMIPTWRVPWSAVVNHRCT
jgi:hypothetical protein